MNTSTRRVSDSLRVTDHRIGLTLYTLDRVIEGEVGEIIEALTAHDQAERLKQGGDAATA